MLQTKQPSKSEQKRMAIQMAAYAKIQEKIADVKEEKSAPLRQADPKLGIAVIIDIDGTLAKRCDRGIFDFEKSIDDEPNLGLIYLLNLIDDQARYKNSAVPGVTIIVVTGREQMYQEVTNKWLNRHQIPFNHVYMRRTGDKRKSNIVKEDIYISSIRNKYNVLFAVDDRQQDIDMYRKNGIYCFVADNSRE